MSDFARVLILETSGKIGQIALAAEGKIVGVHHLPEARRHARDLAARLRDLLAERGWRARDLTAIVVGLGPGSYTGLRVGIASAKALAYATGSVLFGVPTFEAIARSVVGTAPALEVIADAQQGQIYVQQFARQTASAGWESTNGIDIRPFDEWAGQLAADTLIAGPAASFYAARLPEGIRLVAEENREARAEYVLEAACENFRYRSNLWEVEPIYMRGSSAEEKRKKEG